LKDRFPRKLRPVSAAIGTAIAIVELSAAEREVALRLPIKEAQRELAKNLAKDLDAALLEAVQRYLGRPIETEADVRGHLTVHPDDHTIPFEQRGEMYAMDLHPILWAGPVKVEKFGDPGDEHVRASRELRHHMTASEAAEARGAA
jgi:hypothetical protein